MVLDLAVEGVFANLLHFLIEISVVHRYCGGNSCFSLGVNVLVNNRSVRVVDALAASAAHAPISIGNVG